MEARRLSGHLEMADRKPTVRKVTTPAVPEPPGGIFSNCLVVGDQVLLSGVTASGPDGKAIGGDSMEAQARAALTKIRHLLEAAGASMADVVKMTVYVTDMSRRADVGRVRAEFFVAEPRPCSTMLEVKGFVTPDLLIEIDATAVLPSAR
jgi:2-iminobutanoate/2-iminopropanoate deaminase